MLARVTPSTLAVRRGFLWLRRPPVSVRPWRITYEVTRPTANSQRRPERVHPKGARPGLRRIPHKRRPSMPQPPAPPEAPSPPLTLDINEAASVLRSGRSTVYKLITAGELES